MQIFSCVARSTFLRAQVPASPVVSPPTLLSVGRDRLLTAACGGSFYAMVLLAIGSGWRRVGREFLRDGVGRDRQRTATRGGLVLVMESLATSIGCGRRRVEGRGVSVAIG